MVVIVLEKCPLALRGDLTKWLQEVSLGVYVGQVSARVRDHLWERVCAECRNGRATMVFSARNEQHYDFRVHNTIWEPIDFDGIKLMLRPSPTRIKRTEGAQMHFSDASKRKMVRKSVGRKKALDLPTYVVVDLETTGTDEKRDEIIELCAIKVSDGLESGVLCSFVRGATELPDEVAKLTGITRDDIDGGEEIETLLDRFLDFVEDYPLVMHNASFDMGFLDAALEQCGFDEMENECVDTLSMARKRLPKAPSYRLGDLCDYLEVSHDALHRALNDCRATNGLYQALLEA